MNAFDVACYSRSPKFDTVSLTGPDRTVVVSRHKIRHEGAPVISGTKYAMRTDTIYEGDDAIGALDA